jgi:RNA polymerase sigma-70 factor (ECF subfamily)
MSLGPDPQSFLEQFRADDGTMFGIVCGAARPVLARWLRARGLPEDSIDDVLQAAFLSAWVRRRAYGGRGSVVGWLLRIARSEGNRLRRCELKNTLTGAGGWDPAAPLDDADDDAIRRFLDTGGDEQLSIALRSLTPRQRDAVTMYYYHDYSTRQIGDALRCGENGAKSLLHRSRQRIRRALAPALTP